MKEDQELLARVARTMRDRTAGQENTSARTRERVLTSIRRRNKRRSFWFKGSIPGGVLLLGTTAWAQATHQWPAVWRTIEDILSLPVSSEGNSEHEVAVRMKGRPNSPRDGALPVAAPPATLEPAPNGLSTEPGVTSDTSNTPNVEVVTAPSGTPENKQQHKLEGSTLRRTTPLPRTRNTPPKLVRPVEAEPTEPASEPEIAAFRAANDLDLKQRNLGAALSAYRLYLRDYPGGRFVPEARYNSAIILVKLGHRDEARRELTPFASGRYGAHRQARAAKLLAALEQTAP